MEGCRFPRTLSVGEVEEKILREGRPCERPQHLGLDWKALGLMAMKNAWAVSTEVLDRRCESIEMGVPRIVQEWD